MRETVAVIILGMPFQERDSAKELELLKDCAKKIAKSKKLREAALRHVGYGDLLDKQKALEKSAKKK